MTPSALAPPASDALLRAWAETLSRRARDAAVFDTRGAVSRTFGDIEQEALAIAAGELGALPNGAVVAIQLGNNPTWPAALLACLRRSLVALPLERTISPQEREAALQVCRAAALMTSGTDGAVDLARQDRGSAEWGEQQPTVLKLTSGTTAAPRAIPFRSEQLLADCAQICETMGITDADVSFGVIPVSHSYGLSNLITPLIARGVPLVLSQDRMPRAILDDLARTNATVFPGMPVFYQAFSEMERVPALPRLRLCISAGAPLSLPVAQKFRERFGKPIHSFYGSSECGGICYDREAPLLEQGFVGAPMCGVTIELLEHEGVGRRIRVTSAAAADGYFPEPDESKLARGHFAPDDLLEPSPSGFKIVGRVSDVINVAGKKVNPAEVEAALLAFAGVRQAVVFGRGSSVRNEEIAACIVAEHSCNEAELLEFCRVRLSGWQVPKRVFLVDEIPTNERGKISRRALAEQFAA